LSENPGISFYIATYSSEFYWLTGTDQNQRPRPVNDFGDIGAIEAAL